ncbi:hypothetical protein SNE40_021416 [Patella caerulea]|uniref:Reverse transcriptase domain-containing protein n=1 Tax=Patella caerulea TaxID=87958 RepID=A0AAN8G4C1_PATCE
MANDLNINWEEYLREDDPNVLFDLFLAKFNKAKEKSIPKIDQKKAYKAKKHNYIPLDDKTVKRIKKKHRCWQRYMETKDGKLYQEYIKTRNQVKSLIRKAKKNMEKDIAKNAKTNPKKFWQYANSKRKTKPGIAELKTKQENGEIKTTKSEQEKAEVLAEFFTSVFTVEPEGEIPGIEERIIHQKFINLPIKEEDITKLLKELIPTKSTGPDGLHPKALKELHGTIAKPLTIIFNASLQSGKVPDLWKIGNIIALFKKGDKSDPGNYRPVSLTSVACKLMEKEIRAVIVKHMVANKLFSKKQFGFISGRSTTLQLLKVMDEWTEIIDNGGSIDAIYMDFMKAFDKVPHRRLIKKLDSYGLSKTIIVWVEDFLNNRKQKVSVNGHESRQQNVTSGIPQGSVLGPILFVIYINDMPDCVLAPTYLFADDTKIYAEIKNKDDSNSLQYDLDKLQQWSNKWLLRFHPNKCKVVRVTNKKFKEEQTTQEYNLYNQNGEKIILEYSEGEKDIGVLVDRALNFSKHIQQQVNKANSIMGLIRRTFTHLDETTFKYLFQALVRPNLEYAAAVWSPHRKNDINSIENVQRRATKLIPSLKNLEYQERLRKLKMPTLTYRRRRGDIITK